MKRIVMVLGAGLAFALPSSLAFPDDVSVACGPISEMKDAEKYRDLSHDEWTAMRTAFFMAPDTPTALPPGEKAMILERDDGSATVVFVDGADACSPMRISKDGVALLRDIRSGKINHALGRM